VINFPVDGRSIWGWRFEPSEQINALTVRDLLDEKKMAPYALSSPPPIQLLERHIGGGSAAAKAPLLIRFNQFDPDLYRKRLGREESKFVFMIHYDDVANLSLSDAADLE
jgi:hypothetical protein